MLHIQAVSWDPDVDCCGQRSANGLALPTQKYAQRTMQSPTRGRTDPRTGETLQIGVQELSKSACNVFKIVGQMNVQFRDEKKRESLMDVALVKIYMLRIICELFAKLSNFQQLLNCIPGCEFR